MKSSFEKNLLSILPLRGAFTLVEIVTALAILALICSSVLLVIDRCITSAADSSLRMQAFEVARENMEALLAQDSVSEFTEYDTSEKYPSIQWQTAVETFYEPLTSRMWLKAVCSADYINSTGNTETIELTHWLTDLTKEDLLRLIEEKRRRLDMEDEVVDTVEDAAEYAKVDPQTVQQWLDNGMPKTEDGKISKGMLDLYKKYNGKPPEEAVKEQKILDDRLFAPWTGKPAERYQPGEQGTPDEPSQPDTPEQPDETESEPYNICDNPPGPDVTLQELLNWIRMCMR